MAKTIFYLENLDCAHCASEMERQISRLPQVASVSLVFATGQLHITAENPLNLLPEIEDIVHKIEPKVSVSAHRPGSHPVLQDCPMDSHHEEEECACGHHHHEEEECACGHHHGTKKIYYLENLGCAHCASKIEAQAAALPQVEAAALVFPTRQLHITCSDHSNLLPILEKIVHSVEPEANIYDRDPSVQETKKTTFSPDLAVIGGGALLFILGLVLRSPDWLSLVCFVAAYLILGLPVLKTAGSNLLHGRLFDENFLMGIATLGAFAIRQYPEAVGVMLFFRIGEAFEAKAVARSRQEIMSAVDLRPETVTLAQTGITIPAEQAVEGDILLVHPGDRIPLDGVVLTGESRVNTAPITGEPVPVSVRQGDTVTSGCINESGKLTMKVEKTLEHSMVTTILEAVENASASKPKIDRFIGRFSRVYTPIVVILALFTAIIPSLITGQWDYWVYTSLSFLVMSCPCALVLSVPLAFFSGIGAGSRQGILFKGGLSMEALANVKAVAMDKTGTVTKGNFALQKVVGPEGLLSLCASCEQHSTHPIAQSIVTAAKDLKISLQEPEFLEEIPGCGLRAVLDGKTVLCGNSSLMEKFSVSVDEKLPGTAVLVTRDGQYLGYLQVADTVKPEAPEAIRQLSAMGIATAMVTGDSREPAEEVARKVGIGQVFARLLPQDKLDVLKKLRAEKGPVMFVGDGINDAPVLAGADVGAAMGSGADAAIEAADVVFMTSELDAVPKAVKISHTTRTVAWENVIFALAIKISVMILGLLGHANMWLAVFADTGVAMLCVLNSIRVLYKK